jgi:hypothetical protein
VNIDWVIPCRYVEVHDNLGTIIGAGIDTYWVAELPGQIQVFLAVRLVAAPEELASGEPHFVVNRILDPSGEVMHEVQGEIVMGGEAARPDWLVGTTVPMVAQFDAAEEGAHTIEIGVDDATESVPIHVVVGMPPGFEAPATES